MSDMPKQGQQGGQARPTQAPGKPPGEVVDLPARPAASAEARLAKPARRRGRHNAVLLSFLVAVVLPGAGVVGYLHLIAADQYASRMAFSVRGAEVAPSASLFGALANVGGGLGAGPDAEIVYETVRSQQMVNAAMAALPLEELWNVAADDVVFRLGEDRPIEDIVDYWNWMTDVSYETGSGIVHFEARAFDAASAHAIAAFVLEESVRVVNALSDAARADAVDVARGVLTEAEDRLRGVRRSLRAFRDVEQALDPSENARAALGLVATLEADLARAQIELDTETALVGPRSPRIRVLNQTIESLETRIAVERTRLGAGASLTDPVGAYGGAESARALADLVADYEDLVVDREFAENAYVSALSAYETAQVEARRQARYLTPHIRPTVAATPEYPQRVFIAGGALLVLTALWGAMLLVVYNIRDRR